MSETRRGRLAVIDDSEIVLESIDEGLTRLGWSVRTFSNRHGVTVDIIEWQPDVVLVDVNMPLLTGESVMKILSSRLGDSLLLLHSSLPVSELRPLVRKAEADGFVAKGSDIAALDRQILSLKAAKSAA